MYVAVFNTKGQCKRKLNILKKCAFSKLLQFDFNVILLALSITMHVEEELGVKNENKWSSKEHIVIVASMQTDISFTI